MESEGTAAVAEEGLGAVDQAETGEAGQAETQAPETQTENAAAQAPAADGQADGDSGADKADESKPEGAESIGVPKDGYSNADIKMPEGVRIDEQATSGLAEVCKELGLSQKAYGRIIEHMAPVLLDSNQGQIAKLRETFIENSRKDPEIGGAKLQGTLKEASKAYMTYADAELRGLFQKTGLDCHPGMIRMFKRIQEAVGDDRIIRGEPAGSKKDAAKAFFYNSSMND